MFSITAKKDVVVEITLQADLKFLVHWQFASQATPGRTESANKVNLCNEFLGFRFLVPLVEKSSSMIEDKSDDLWKLGCEI